MKNNYNLKEKNENNNIIFNNDINIEIKGN